MPSSSRTIVVFEARPRWEPELQRQFTDEPVRVRGCRTWADLSAIAFAPPTTESANRVAVRTVAADAIVIEVPEDAAACLQWAGNLAARTHLPPVIVLCQPETAELEWPLRDAGVEEVFVGELSGEQLARCCRRLWDRFPNSPS